MLLAGKSEYQTEIAKVTIPLGKGLFGRVGTTFRFPRCSARGEAVASAVADQVVVQLNSAATQGIYRPIDSHDIPLLAGSDMRVLRGADGRR
jgi:hypothetical protein